MAQNKYQDDVFVHLDADVDKMRVRFRQYISYGNEKGAFSLFVEAVLNFIDEQLNPRSPCTGAEMWLNEQTGFFSIKDDGRGIPTDILEDVFTSLNMGSNIDTSEKAQLKSSITGQNGVGTLAVCALSEDFTVTSYRGGTENKFRTIKFHEGRKVSEETGPCHRTVHGLFLEFKPSKIMGKNTRFVWSDVQRFIENLAYLDRNKAHITLHHTKEDGTEETFEYKDRNFIDILKRNEPESMISTPHLITVNQDEITEEIDGREIPRFISLDVAFVYTSSIDPYIDSFANSTNTVDGGDHLDGSIESLCRFFQNQTKSTMSEREREKLDIKWDDVKAGLSIVVALRTNWERLYTGQTKHKVVSSEVRKIIQQLLSEELSRYFEKNQSKNKELIQIIKTNARARRESEKVKSSIVKSGLSNLNAYRMKSFDPCTARGLKDYKELYIVEGLSARGSLKVARDPHFQALLAIRGVIVNVYKMTQSQIFGPKGNRECIDLFRILGAGIGDSFDLSKCGYNKVIIATDADVDGLNIRALLICLFYFYARPFMEDGRLYIAEPPLYRVDSKRDPFVVNKAEYTSRYCTAASKDYRIGYPLPDGGFKYVDRRSLEEFLNDTRYYVEDMTSLCSHYRVNDRLLEMILEEASVLTEIPDDPTTVMNIPHLMNDVNAEFPELRYDIDRKTIVGAANKVSQTIGITKQLLTRAAAGGLIDLIRKYKLPGDQKFILHSVKSKEDQSMSMLELLKVLRKYQPEIVHRFKGLGENEPEDIKTTIMDPNTRSLIRVVVGDVSNNAEIFKMLRGDSPIDRLNRREAYRNFRFDPREDIDT